MLPYRSGSSFLSGLACFDVRSRPSLPLTEAKSLTYAVVAPDIAMHRRSWFCAVHINHYARSVHKRVQQESWRST